MQTLAVAPTSVIILEMTSSLAPRGSDLAASYGPGRGGKIMCLLAYWPSWRPFWTGGMWLLPLLFIVLCVVGMLFCSRMCCGRARPSLTSQGNQSARPESPLDIAKRRFAQGEITKEEYEEIKRTLA